MKRFICAVYTGILILTATSATATAPPDQVVTIFVHGFDPGGGSNSGPVGNDIDLSYAAEFATAVGLPYGLTNPVATNQVIATTYYGNQYPAYYTAQDITDVNGAGQGVPRYAQIVAKHISHVLDRSGASQATIVGASFGALISRYVIQKDIENLASSGKIARWIGVEGVVEGNYAATNGGILAEIFFEQHYGGSPVDLQHMNYVWVQNNLGTPTLSQPWFTDIPMHFWIGGDDNLYAKFVTGMSGKANDGVVLVEDAVLRNLPAELLYHNLLPTQSVLHANHNTLKTQPGLFAGMYAQLFGRNRATVKLKDVRVLREFDGGARGQGEYVFGVKVFSPAAEAMGAVGPVNDLRAEDNTFPFVRLSVDSQQSLNLPWFDDMLLPGETQLRLVTNVEEIDGDEIYQVNEVSGTVRQALENTEVVIDATQNGEYPLVTGDWVGTISVEANRYPAFFGGGSSADNWGLYE